MIRKQLDRLTSQDLFDLVEQRVRESRYLDYKGTYSLAGDACKNELRKDAAAMANAAGGHLVVGVVEEELDGRRTGFPREAVGLSNAEDLRKGISAVLRAKIDPPMQANTVLVPGFANGACLVVHVPQSRRAPHMVVDTKRFPLRVGEEIVDMDTSQLREAFLASDTMAERARGWVGERLSALQNRHPGAPQLFSDPGRRNPQLLFYFGTTDCFASSHRSRLFERARATPGAFAPFGYGTNPRLTFDGLFLPGGRDDELDAYALVFRSGWFEAAKAISLTSNEHAARLPHAWIENLLVEQATALVKEAAACGCLLPFFAFITLRDVLGLALSMDSYALDRSILRLPEVFIEELETLSSNHAEAAATVAKALRPALDVLAHAAGLNGSPSFQGDTWMPRRA